MTLMQVYAEDHGSPQQSATTVVYVVVEGSERPDFESHNYLFGVRESQSLHFATIVLLHSLACDAIRCDTAINMCRKAN